MNNKSIKYFFNQDSDFTLIKGVDTEEIAIEHSDIVLEMPMRAGPDKEKLAEIQRIIKACPCKHKLSFDFIRYDGMYEFKLYITWNREGDPVYAGKYTDNLHTELVFGYTAWMFGDEVKELVLNEAIHRGYEGPEIEVDEIYLDYTENCF